MFTRSIEPPYKKTAGTFNRNIAIIMPGNDLSVPAPNQAIISMSSHETSIESAIISRDTKEDFIPSCPIAIPSVTVIVVNSLGVPILSLTPSLIELDEKAKYYRVQIHSNT